MISRSQKFINETATVTVLDPDSPTKERIPFAELYSKAQGPIIIKFLRRFGCLLCREGAFDLCELKPELDKKYGKDSVSFYAIGLELFGYEEFKNDQYFPCGKILIDDKKKLYEIAGFIKDGVFSGLAKYFSSATQKRIKEANKKGFDGNWRGDKSQIGGVLILTPKGEIIYEFKQKNLGDEPKKDEILRALDLYFSK